MSKPFKFPVPSEHQIQSSLVQHFHARSRPDVFWFSVPYEAWRSPVTGKRMKDTGLRPGTPDLCFVIDGRAYFLEFKRHGGSLRKSQKELRGVIETSVTRSDSAYGIDEALGRLKSWGRFKIDLGSAPESPIPSLESRPGVNTPEKHQRLTFKNVVGFRNYV